MLARLTLGGSSEELSVTVVRDSVQAAVPLLSFNRH